MVQTQIFITFLLIEGYITLSNAKSPAYEERLSSFEEFQDIFEYE